MTVQIPEILEANEIEAAPVVAVLVSEFAGVAAAGVEVAEK